MITEYKYSVCSTYGGENPRLNPHITLLEVSDWTNEKVVVAQNAYHESWPYSQCAGTGSTEYEVR